MNQEERARKTSQIIAKSWADDGFKGRLLSNPMDTLKAEGVEIPAGVTVKVLENTSNVVHLVLPAKPTDLSDEELDKVAGGASTGPSSILMF